jgi:2-oxo-4-hydroxy-4-carboxy-5-ureidoimidazoline decarboxylase
MNDSLNAWNTADSDSAVATLLSCCAAKRWAETVASQRPYPSEEALFVTADRVWAAMQEPDWLQAFSAHPRIGERKPAEASPQSQQWSSQWSSQEQASVHSAQSAILDELTAGNLLYEEQFGFTYIVCATGKSAEEMLSILRKRLASDRESELHEAAEQQHQITQLRLRKWLQQ